MPAVSVLKAKRADMKRRSLEHSITCIISARKWGYCKNRSNFSIQDRVQSWWQRVKKIIADEKDERPLDIGRQTGQENDKETKEWGKAQRRHSRFSVGNLISGVQLKNGAELIWGLSKHVSNAMVLTGLGLGHPSINQQSMHSFFELQ